MNSFNSFNNGYPTGGPYQGMIYQEAPKLQMTQGLTQEQMKALRKTSGFNLDITQDELWRAFCTHRYETRYATSNDEEGNYSCAICGSRFQGYDGSVQDSRELIQQVINFCETLKIMGVSLPTKTIQDVFQIIPILKRLPELYEQVINDFKRATGNSDSYTYGQEGNAFVQYQNMINPMAGASYYYDPAMMNMGQPQMMPNNYGMNQGYPTNNGMNMNMGQPQMNPFNSNPAPQQQPQNNPNQSTEQVTVSKTLTD